MKVITLHQPWASLIALGAKTIETRSWSTKYRGPLAIHAGTARPPMMHLPPLSRNRGPAADEHNRQTWSVMDTITDPAYQGMQPQVRRTPKRATTPTMFYPHAGPHSRPWDPDKGPATGQGTAIYLPLGAIVATCTLAGIAPIVNPDTCRWDSEGLDGPPSAHAAIDGQVVLHSIGGWRTVVTMDLPYGDFRPGRYAWLLTDITPLAQPVPFKGGQGLTRTWEPA